MFKSEEQVRTFVDLQEKFIKAIIHHQTVSSDIQAAANLNKYREGFEAFLNVISGLTVASNTEPEELLCPDCGSAMSIRTNRTNGNKFYGCKKYPNCKGTRDENGLSRADREEKKQREDNIQQSDGFSFNKPKRDVVNEVSLLDVETHKGEHTWINPFRK